MLVKFENEKVVFFRGTTKELKAFCKQYKKVQPVQTDSTPVHNVIGYHQRTVTDFERESENE